MTNAITVENLSKKYVIGHQRLEKYTALRDVLMHKLRATGQRLRHPLSPNREKTSLEEFWALKDINFEIKQGDRVGIIGRNGAGKSTLLKILSRITEPTAGRITINGRVASLLEVGTGFHPELTGRENIFLNGAILGMSRLDIKSKFDEIVAFAEVEKFLDTPVKRYSSGMYVRLAFAVAAHLEPDILIVDEVLAVGDAQFQEKCLGKMEDVSNTGRTILFVSHNMRAIKRLCQKGILLDKGMAIKQDDTRSIIESYLSCRSQQELNVDILPEMHKYYPPCFEVFRVELINESNEINNQVRMNETYRLRLKYKIKEKRRNYFISISVCSYDGLFLGTVSSIDAQEQIKFDSSPCGCIEAEITNIFNPGKYILEIKIKSGRELIDLIEGVGFEVLPASIFQDIPIRVGIVRMNAKWRAFTYVKKKQV